MKRSSLGMLASKAAVSRELGCSLPTGAAWIRSPEFPAKGPNGWKKTDVLLWYEKHEKEKALRLAGQAGGDDKKRKLALQCELLAEQTRERRLICQEQEEEAKVRAGLLVDADTVRGWAGVWVGRVVESWQAIEYALDARLTDRAAMADVRSIIDKARADCVAASLTPVEASDEK